MIVTRSSVLSLQAKQGLPRGEQVLGWTILGMSLFSNPPARKPPVLYYVHPTSTIDG
jgi:phosphatidylinositol glycan class N